MNFAVALTTFLVVFPAELPDKTALASLTLGSRYRPAYVFTGVAAAFVVPVALALVAGGLIGLLPHRALEAIVAVLFGLGARYHDPVAVGTGGLLALWSVAALAIAGGRGLLKVIPVRTITLIGAGVMAVLAVISLIAAIRG